MSFLVLLTAWLLRAPILTAAATVWVVNDPVTNADAIVVLGGRPDLRAVEAARLYHQGVAPKILYMDIKLGPSEELGIVPSEREQTHRLLISNTVPEAAMEAIGNSVASTFDESQAVRSWSRTHKAKSILIPTDLSHTRRVRWLFTKQLKETGTEVHVRAIEPKEYHLKDWWKHEEGLIAFQNEHVKSVFYWLKY